MRTRRTRPSWYLVIVTTWLVLLTFVGRAWADPPPPPPSTTEEIHRLIEAVFDRVVVYGNEAQGRAQLEAMRQELKTRPLAPGELVNLLYLNTPEGQQIKLSYMQGRDLASFSPAWDGPSGRHQAEIVFGSEELAQFRHRTTTLQRMFHESDHARRYSLDDPAANRGLRVAGGAPHLTVLDEIQSWVNSGNVTVAEAIEMVKERYPGQLELIVDQLDVADLSPDEQYRVIRELVDAYPDSNPFADGSLLSRAKHLVAGLIQRLRGIEYRASIAEFIAPPQASKVKAVLAQVGQGAAKAVPVIGIGAALYFFREDWQEAEHWDEYLDATLSNLAGVVPVYGDAWDIGYTLGEIIGDAIGVDVALRWLFFDSGEEQDEINERRQEQLDQIRATKEAARALEASHEGEITPTEAEQRIEDTSLRVESVRVPAYATGVVAFVPGFLEELRAAAQARVALERDIVGLPESALLPCFGVARLTPNPDSACELSPAEVGFGPGAGGTDLSRVCQGVVRITPSPRGPCDLAPSQTPPGFASGVRGDPNVICQGRVQTTNPAGICYLDPRSVPGVAFERGVPASQVCQGMVQSTNPGGLCYLEPESGFDPARPTLDPREVCQGEVQTTNPHAPCYVDARTVPGYERPESISPEAICQGIVQTHNPVGLCYADPSDAYEKSLLGGEPPLDPATICQGMVQFTDPGAPCYVDPVTVPGERHEPGIDPRDLCLGNYQSHNPSAPCYIAPDTLPGERVLEPTEWFEPGDTSLLNPAPTPTRSAGFWSWLGRLFSID